MAPDASPARFAAVLVMAGDGRRLGADVPKAFVPLGGQPMWRHAATTLASASGCVALVLVAPADHVDALTREAEADFPGVVVVAGGARRQDSVRLGIGAITADVAVIAVHDAARPLVTREVVEEAVRVAADTGAAFVAARVRDTVKYVEDGRVVDTLDRERLWNAQTPQCFRPELLARAHAEAERLGIDVTDDAMLVERLGAAVRIVETGAWNLKVTVPDDLVAAEALLRARARGGAGA
jgi:2-C-methyl-D-erythritol 4-phosphate cytidylyltransferase